MGLSRVQEWGGGRWGGGEILVESTGPLAHGAMLYEIFTTNIVSTFF